MGRGREGEEVEEKEQVECEIGRTKRRSRGKREGGGRGGERKKDCVKRKLEIEAKKWRGKDRVGRGRRRRGLCKENEEYKWG